MCANLPHLMHGLPHRDGECLHQASGSGYQLPPPTLHLWHLPGMQQCKNWGCSMSQGYICAWDGAVVNPRDAAVSGMGL